MKKKVSVITFVLLFFISLSNARANINLPKLVKKLQPAIVTIITYGKDNKILQQGSGFFIDSSGHLVTNYHVLDGAYHAKVQTYDGKNYPIKSVIGETKIWI